MDRPFLFLGPNTPSLRAGFNLVDVMRPVQPCILGHLHTWGCFEAIDRLSEELYWPGRGDTPTDLCEDHRGAHRDIDGNPLFFQPPQ